MLGPHVRFRGADFHELLKSNSSSFNEVCFFAFVVKKNTSLSYSVTLAYEGFLLALHPRRALEGPESFIWMVFESFTCPFVRRVPGETIHKHLMADICHPSVPVPLSPTHVLKAQSHTGGSK